MSALSRAQLHAELQAYKARKAKREAKDLERVEKLVEATKQTGRFNPFSKVRHQRRAQEAGVQFHRRTSMAIEPGAHLMARTATGTKVPRRAVTGIQDGDAFPVVWVCREEEFETAKQEGRPPVAVPWPANAVEALPDV